ncbi:MAG: S-layer family protein [Candidatus Aenigmarchaeota archaeon]|nr:S-layer family protein [Candidatus Aenigmarchaeota archaeon]
MLILSVVLLSGPANAISIGLYPNGANGGTYNYRMVIDLHANDHVPLDYIVIHLANLNESSEDTCYFEFNTLQYDTSVNGDVQPCHMINITGLVNNATYSGAYGYSFGYGTYGNYSNLSGNNVSWNAEGYNFTPGYGYDSYNPATSMSGEITVEFSINTIIPNGPTAGHEFAVRAGVSGMEGGSIKYSFYSQNEAFFTAQGNMGGGGDNWNDGLSSWRSGIVSPYVLIGGEPKMLNFTVYRQAGDQSCLENLTIHLPHNFTYLGSNWTNSVNSSVSAREGAVFWEDNGSGGFFCGEGPVNFAILVNTSDGLGKTSFLIEAYAKDNTTSNFSKMVFIATTFNYTGSVKDSEGNNLSGAVASMYAVSHSMDGETVIGTFTGLTDENGEFIIENVPGMNISYEEEYFGPMEISYRLSAARYNDSEGNYAMHIGPSLPDVPEMEIKAPWGLGNATIYLKEAVTFHVRALGKDYRSGPNNTNETCPGPTCPPEWTPTFNQTYVNFDYNLKDKKLGYPVSNSQGQDSNERWFAAPLERNYSLMLFPDASFQVYVDFVDISSRCNSTGYNLSTTGVNATCTIQNGTYLIDAEITGDMNLTNMTGSINLTDLDSFWIVAYMLGAGEMLFDQDSLPFNIGQMERWPKNDTTYDDSYNRSAGTYNIYLPATQAHSDVLLVAYASKSGTYYQGIHKISVEGMVLPETIYNFTMRELISGSDYPISVNNVSGDWNSTNVVNTTAVVFNLVDSNGEMLETESSFIETRIDAGEAEYQKMLNAENGSFSMVLASGQGLEKLTVYSQTSAPLSVPVRSTVLSGSESTEFMSCQSGVCNVTLREFEPFDPETKQALEDIKMEFMISNSSCDVPNPSEDCYLMSDMSKDEFSPLKAILLGDISLRIILGNLSVHYMKTDLMASGPPDAALSQNFTGDDLNAAWKFGSSGPEIYSGVLIGMPYSEALDNMSIRMSIPVLYDAEFNVIWNRTDGNTTSELVGTDYEDYLNNSYEEYLNGTGVYCSEANENLTEGLCYRDTSTRMIWMEIPHFSGVGPQVVSFDLPSVALTLSDPSPVKAGNVTFTVDFSTAMNTSSNVSVLVSNASSYNVTPIGWANSTRWTSWYNFNASTGDGVYQVHITGAVDSDGNPVSEDSSNYFILDTTNPAISITSPINNSVSSTQVIEINLTLTEANLDYTNISLINASTGIVVNSTTSTSTGAYSVYLSAYEDGAYNITAVSYDLAGNTNTVTTSNITVDAEGPSITVISPASGAYQNTLAISVNLTVTDTSLNYTNVSVYNSTGGLVYSNSSSANGNYLLTLYASGEGAYYITAVAYDTSGRNSSESVNITLDITSPAAAISSINGNASGDWTRSRTLLVTATAGDANIQSWLLSAYNSTGNLSSSANGSTSFGPSDVSLIVQRDGNYNVTLNVTDRAGNSNVSSFTIRVDATAPHLITLTLNATIVNVNDSIEITCSALDNVDANVSTVNTSVDTSAPGVFRVNCTATDDAGNTNTTSVGYVVLGGSAAILTENVTVNSTETTLVVPESNNDTHISVPSDITNASIDLGILLNDTGTDRYAILNGSINVSANTSEGIVEVFIPANTTINGSSGWSGEVDLPEIAADGSVTVTPDSGKTATVSKVVELGSGSVHLVFTRAVRILIPGEAGKYAGYYRDGTFTKITATCANDSQDSGDALAYGSDCKIDSGNDLVVWTKHFTSFVTYTQADLPGSPSSGPRSSSVTGTSSGYWYGTHTVSKESMAAGYTTILRYRHRLKLNISDEVHYVGVVNTTTEMAILNVSSDPIQVILPIGDDAKIDLDGDYYYDLYIKLNGIEATTTNITLKEIHEYFGASGGTVANTTPQVQPEEKPPIYGGPKVDSCRSGAHRCIDSEFQECRAGTWVTVELCIGGCDSSGNGCVSVNRAPESQPAWGAFALVLLLLAVALVLVISKRPKVSEKHTEHHPQITHSKFVDVQGRIAKLESKGHNVSRMNGILEEIRQDISSGLHYIAEGRLEILSREVEFLEGL